MSAEAAARVTTTPSLGTISPIAYSTFSAQLEAKLVAETSALAEGQLLSTHEQDVLVATCLDSLRLVSDLPTSLPKVWLDLTTTLSKCATSFSSPKLLVEQLYTEMVDSFYFTQLMNNSKTTLAEVERYSQEAVQLYHKLPLKGQKSTSALIRLLIFQAPASGKLPESSWKQFLSLRQRTTIAYAMFRALIKAHENSKTHSRAEAERYSIDDNLSSHLVTACTKSRMPIKAMIVTMHMWVVLLADIARCG
jgi:hypothetical protein